VNKEYFDIIMEKMERTSFEGFETDLSSYNDHLGRVTVKLFHNVKVTIRSESDMLKIEVENRFKRIEQQIKFPMKVCIFSLSWWKWKAFARKIEKAHKMKRLLELKEVEKLKKLEMHQTMSEIFPEIYEKDLLGDDDDK
jgi:hypothetical protein